MYPKPSSPNRKLAEKYLKGAAVFWFVTTFVGQLLFVAYLLLFYVRATFKGDFEAWNKVLPNGFVAGELLGNTATGIHIFVAVAIMVFGLTQLIPAIRAIAPRVHKWSGRIYLVSCVITSFVGLYMVWRHGGSPGKLTQNIGISLDAVLIILFSALTLKYALARQIATHRRWALRLFMVASAVWFFRVGLMFWIFINQGPVGIDMQTFTGPFLSFLSFADYLIPLALLEMYLRAKTSQNLSVIVFSATLIVVATLAMGIGIVVATMGLWLPHM